MAVAVSVHLVFAGEREYHLAVTVLSARGTMALQGPAEALRAVASAVYHDRPLPGQLPEGAHVVALGEALEAIRLEARLHRKPRTYEPWRVRRRRSA